MARPAEFSSSLERYGLKLIEEPPPARVRERATARAAPFLSLHPPSLFDRLIVLGLGALLLTYVVGIGLGLGWTLGRLFGV